MTALSELSSITTIPDYLSDIITALKPYSHNIDENPLPSQISSVKQFCQALEALIIFLHLKPTLASTLIPHFVHLCHQFNIIHLNNLLSPRHPSIQQQTILYDTIESTFASPTRLFTLSKKYLEPISLEFVSKFLHNVRLHYGDHLKFYQASLPTGLSEDQITTLTTLLQLSYPTPMTSSYFHQIFFPTLTPQELKEQLFQFYSKDIQIEDIFSGIIHPEEQQSTIIAPTTFSSSEPNRITFKPFDVIEALLDEIIPYTIPLPNLSIYSYLGDNTYGSLFRFALLTSLLQIKTNHFSTLCTHLLSLLKEERSLASFATQRKLYEERSQDIQHTHFSTNDLYSIPTTVFGSYLLHHYPHLTFDSSMKKDCKFKKGKAPYVPENFIHRSHSSGLKYLYTPNIILTKILPQPNPTDSTQPNPTTRSTQPNPTTEETLFETFKSNHKFHSLFDPIFSQFIDELCTLFYNHFLSIQRPPSSTMPQFQEPPKFLKLRQLVLYFQIVAAREQHTLLSQTYPMTNIQHNSSFSDLFSSQIQTNIDFLYSTVVSQVLTSEYAQKLTSAKNRVDDLIKTLSQAKYSAALSGSCSNGLAQISSDIDLKLIPNSSNLDTDPTALEILSKLEETLQKQHTDNVKVFKPLDPSATTVVLKITVDDIPCDISLSHNQIDAEAKTRLLRTFLTLNPIVYPLVTLVKYWATQRGIYGAVSGFFNSFSLSLLIIFFLQSKGMLPVVHQNMPPNPRILPITLDGLPFKPSIIPLIVKPTSAEPPSPYFYLPSILQPLRPPSYGEYVNLEHFSNNLVNPFPSIVNIDDDYSDCDFDADEVTNATKTNYCVPLDNYEVGNSDEESIYFDPDSDWLEEDDSDYEAYLADEYCIKYEQDVRSYVPIYHLTQHLDPTITPYNFSSLDLVKPRLSPTLYSTDDEISSFLLQHKQSLFSIDWSWFSHHSSVHKRDMNESNDQNTNNNNNNDQNTNNNDNNNKFCAHIGPSGIDDYLQFSRFDPKQKKLLPKEDVSLDTEQSWRYKLHSIEELRTIYPSHYNHADKQHHIHPVADDLHSVVVPHCSGADDPLWKQAFLLLQEFFFFYGFVFNPKHHVISVRTGHFTWLTDYLARNVNFSLDCRLSFFIEDPFDPFNNCARSILPHSCDLIITEFRRAAILSLTNTPIHIILSPVTAEITGLYYFLQNNSNQVSSFPLQPEFDCPKILNKTTLGFLKDDYIQNYIQNYINNSTSLSSDIYKTFYRNYLHPHIDSVSSKCGLIKLCSVFFKNEAKIRQDSISFVENHYFPHYDTPQSRSQKKKKKKDPPPPVI